MTVAKLVEAQENLVKYIDRIIAHRDGYHGIDAGKRDAKYKVHMIVESALSTIDPEANGRKSDSWHIVSGGKEMTNEGSARALADKFFPHCADGPDPKTEWAYNLITAHDDAIRRECAEKYKKIIASEVSQLRRWAIESRKGGWSTHQVDPMNRRADELESILGTEPAREETK